MSTDQPPGHPATEPRRPPRVLVVTTTYPRWKNDHRPRFVADLCERLVSDHGLKVTVVAPHGPGLARRETIRGVAVRRFRYALDTDRQCIAYGPGVADNLHNLAAAKWQLPGFLAAMSASLFRQLGSHDLIHAHWIQPAAIAMLTNLLHRRPVVLTVHRLAPEATRLQRLTLSRVDRALFNSRFTLEQATEQGCRFRGETAYQGFDSSVFGRQPRSGEMRRRLAIPEDALIVTAVARLVRFKGLHILLEDVDALLEGRTNVHLVIAGCGPEKPELERLAGQSEHRHRIHFPGALERIDIAKLLADSDFFVNPGIRSADGRVETLGIAALEAAATGLPAVGTHCGGIPETIDHGVTGLLVEPGDSAALTQALGELLDDPERRATMGRAAQARAFRMFTWEALAHHVVDVYHQVLGRTALSGQ